MGNLNVSSNAKRLDGKAYRRLPFGTRHLRERRPAAASTAEDGLRRVHRKPAAIVELPQPVKPDHTKPSEAPCLPSPRKVETHDLRHNPELRRY